jgi:hypothetical protein
MFSVLPHTVSRAIMGGRKQENCRFSYIDVGEDEAKIRVKYLIPILVYKKINPSLLAVVQSLDL